LISEDHGAWRSIAGPVSVACFTVNRWLVGLFLSDLENSTKNVSVLHLDTEKVERFCGRIFKNIIAGSDSDDITYF
jgi:hypothetical protein